jgi:hypothetical protein
VLWKRCNVHDGTRKTGYRQRLPYGEWCHVKLIITVCVLTAAWQYYVQAILARAQE